MGGPVRTVTAVVFVVALDALLSACSSPTRPTTTSVVVTGTVPAVGETSQLTARIISNGTTQDVTTQATWSSSNTAIATVSATGLLKVLQLGGATITATYQSVSGTLSVLLVTSITISGTVPPACDPDNPCPFAAPSLTFNGPSASFSNRGRYIEIFLTATANISGTGSQDVTAQATWSSSNTGVATVSSAGIVNLGQLGSADITATFQGTTGRLTLSHVSFPCPVSGIRVVGNPQSDPTLQDRFIPKPAGGIYTEKFTITQAGTGSCSWTPITFASWVHAAGSGNVGDGTVTLTVDPLDPSGSGRNTTVWLNFPGQDLVDASRINTVVVRQGFGHDGTEF